MAAYVTPENLEQKTRVWLEQVAPFARSLSLDPQRAALLVIDMQMFFLSPTSPTFACGAPVVLPRIKKLIAAFRQAGRPVIFTRHVHHPDRIDAGIMGWWWQGMCLEGTPESEIHPDLVPLGNEKVVSKHRYSAFFGTDLDIVLRCQEIGDLVIAGTLTNMCCESTARDAYHRDYRVFFLADATATVNEEMHVSSLLNLAFGFSAVTTTRRICAALRRG